MTELQKVEFNILREFIGVCNKLDLTYFLVCGSALGAVKYDGFIPWDDDIDVALPRDDYKKFCEKAQDLLPEYLFVQNYKTERNFPRVYTKLRDSRTTYIEKAVAHLDMNHGIFIDVFPLDGYPSEKADIKRLERKKKIRKLQIECAFEVDYGFLRNTFFKMERILGFHKKTNWFLEDLEKQIEVWSVKDSNLWCNHGNWQKKLEYAPKEQYGEGTWMQYEGMKVRVPERYDEYLTQKYGDWRAELPEEEKSGHHYYEICDVKTSYTEYIKKK